MDLEDNKKLLYNKLLCNNYFINNNNSKAYIKCLKDVVDQVFDLKVTSIRDVNLYSLELIRMHFGLYDEYHVIPYGQLSKQLNTYTAKIGKLLRNSYFELKKIVYFMSKDLMIKEKIKEGFPMTSIYLKDIGLNASSIEELESHFILTLGNLLIYTKDELSSFISTDTYLDISWSLQELDITLKNDNNHQLVLKN